MSETTVRLPVLYVSGPMAGYPEHNYPAFAAATEQLRTAGFKVISPAELGPVEGWAWEDYLRRDLRVMLERCAGVATLDGWGASRGAQLEVSTAQGLRWDVAPWSEWVGRMDLLRVRAARTAYLLTHP